VRKLARAESGRERALVFLTGDRGFMALEPLRQAMGGRFINAGRRLDPSLFHLTAEAMLGGIGGHGVWLGGPLAKYGFEPLLHSLAPAARSGKSLDMSLRRISLRLAPTLVGVAAFGMMAALYRLNTVIYLDIQYFIGLDPWRYPFLDSEFMYAMKNCWQHGVDVYQAVPCDVVPGNKMAYSPLWQRLPFLPTERAARVPIGLATDLLWLLSLTLLPAARAWWEAALLSLATLSSMVCFALERNNIDVWIYLLITVGVLLFIRPGVARALGYAVFLAAALLKYYPFVLFGLALKQRPRGFLSIAGLATAALAIFAVWFWPELREELPNIPAGSPFADYVGLTNLPLAVADLMEMDGPMAPQHRSVVVLGLRLWLLALVFVFAILLARRPGFAAAVARLRETDATWLVAFCLVMGGCYALIQNVSYRGIYLLPVLSGLLALRRASETPALRSRLLAVSVTLMPIMWMEALRHWVAMLKALPVSPFLQDIPIALVWLARELLWLNLERVLIAVLLVFAVQSATVLSVRAWWGRHRRGPAAAG
jgi:hypothetical protein